MKAVSEAQSLGTQDPPAASPIARPAAIQTAALAPTVQQPATPEIVTRLDTTSGKTWGINIGRYPSRYQAEKQLLKIALAEMSTLDGTQRKVAKRSSGYDANFLGMTREMADLACRRLSARQQTCFMMGPG